MIGTQRSTLRVLGLSGSLRRGSYNAALLRAAAEIASGSMTIEIASLAGIPLYDEDLRAHGLPKSVAQLREQIAAADSVLIATPEYNYSVPGVLKNALDWVSRGERQPFDGKPVAIVGAAASTFGTARAQYHLRQILVFLNAHPLNRPEIFVGRAGEKFDGDGRLTDEPTRLMIRDLLTALGDWTHRLSGRNSAVDATE